MSRTISVPEITTAMVTSAYIDLMVDSHLFDKKNRPRNRRILFVLALLMDSFVGAIAYRYVSPALSLLLCATCKAAICLSLLLNRAAVNDQISAGSEFVEQQQPT